VGVLGHYNASKKTLVFGINSITSNELFSHEFFHAYQDQHYSNMELYSLGNPGNVNIEFEQYVFQEISRRMDGYSSTGNSFNSNSTVMTNFRNWINILTNNGKKMPNISEHSDFMDQYNLFLDHYKNIGPPAYRTPKVDLHPQALYDLFDGQGC